MNDSFRTLLSLAMAGMLALPALAEDALSAPDARKQPPLANPPPVSANGDQAVEPADVVDQRAGFTVPTPGKSTPVPTFPPASTRKNDFDDHLKKTAVLPTKSSATPTPKPRSPASKKGDPTVTTIPNPAWGDKVIFRVMTSGPAKARIVVYDRFFNKVADLSGDGQRLFDILWSLKNVSEGLYYYQVEVVDAAAGQTRMLPMQNFAVMKDESPENTR